MTLEEEFNQLERDIRQLGIEYEMYFSGGRPRPPADTQWRVESVIKKFGSGAKLTFSQRFRFDQLVSKFSKHNEVWRRKLKAREEGRVVHHYGAAAKKLEADRAAQAAAHVPAHPTPAPAPGRPERPQGGYQMACSDPEHEGEKVQELYNALVTAKQQAGEQAGVSFDQFQKFVKQKTSQLKSQLGVKEVEYVVALEDGQVKLKAKGKT